MSLKTSVSSKAVEDAITIADHLAEQSSLDMSDRFLSATTKAYRQLASMPGIGSLRDYGPEFSTLRMWPVPRFVKYLIFYQATETELIVIRVMHGSQNIERIFSSLNEE